MSKQMQGRRLVLVLTCLAALTALGGSAVPSKVEASVTSEERPSGPRSKEEAASWSAQRNLPGNGVTPLERLDSLPMASDRREGESHWPPLPGALLFLLATLYAI